MTDVDALSLALVGACLCLACSGGEESDATCNRGGQGLWRQNSPPTEGVSEWSVAAWGGGNLMVWGQAWSDQVRVSCLTDNCVGVAGVRYDPVANHWARMSDVGAPVSRDFAGAARAGDRVVFWGGQQGTYMAWGPVLGDGGIYDPQTDSWELIPESGDGRIFPNLIWTGTQLLVWGGYEARGGAALASGLVYDTVTATWHPMSTPGAPAGVGGAAVAWTGSELLVWGGTAVADGTMVAVGHGSEWPSLGDGAAYDPVSDTWRPMSRQGAPSARDGMAAAWTGQELLLFGGHSPSGMLHDGAAYDPLSDSWRPISRDGAPWSADGRRSDWTGTELVAWTGASECTGGGFYDPLADRWRLISLDGAPHHDNIGYVFWTGTDVLFFREYPVELAPLATCWQYRPLDGP